jgi:hypothetical protein
MKLYRFSPIQTIDQIKEATRYVAERTSQLSDVVIGVKLPIIYLTLFTHYDDEYDQLIKHIANLGETSVASNGIRVKLKEPIAVEEQKITDLRIRKPDPYRTQVGCCDFKTNDYVYFKDKYLSKYSQNLRVIERSEYEMVEFFHPDFVY